LAEAAMIEADSTVPRNIFFLLEFKEKNVYFIQNLRICFILQWKFVFSSMVFIILHKTVLKKVDMQCSALQWAMRQIILYDSAFRLCNRFLYDA